MSPFRKARPLWFTLASLVAIGSVFVVVRVRAEGAPAGAGALTYAGRLESAAGEPLNGPRNIGLALHDAATAGKKVCEAASNEVVLSEGRFSISLPAACVTAVKANPNLWVDIVVDGASLGRAKVGAVPYAVEAGHAVRASSADVASSLAEGPIEGGLVTFNVLGTAMAAPCAVVGGQIVDCVCPAGTFVVSGGADARQNSGAFVRENRALNATTWRLTCASGTADVLCATYNLTCSRLAP